MDKRKALIADDEINILKVIREELLCNGYEVDLAYDGEEANRKITQCKYDVVILDIRMPNKDGIYVLKEIKKLCPETIVIMMTAYGSIGNAVEAMKIGAYDYLTKPFDIRELISKVKQAFRIKENIPNKNISTLDVNYELVGQSEVIEMTKARIKKVKDLATSVLITGESGTGKGVIAKMIHYTSNRRDLPFIHLNCAVLPENLIESELFGHEKGAFTGALETKKGKFELADKGTIFLDEISTLTPNLQAKLLTVLQEKKMERIGGTKTISIGSRIIAATNENIEELVKRREFREDLFYRLNVVTIEVPPLRYRNQDIEPLTLHFLTKLNMKLNKNICNISDEVWDILKKYDWPGNVRELENTIESAIALASDTTLYKEDLPLRISNKVKIEKLENTNSEFNLLEIHEVEAIKNALKEFNGHREKTAKSLGVSRRTLQYKLKKYGLL
jgi:DNA-binding NtrC family response regulator